MRLALLALALLLPAAHAADRLPHAVVPIHYALHFEPDFGSARFAGRATIDISLQQPARRIVLHAAELELRAARIRGVGTEQDARIVPDGAHEQVAFEWERPLGPGTVTLAIDYAGPLRDDQRGWYRGEMFDRPYLATHMEPTDARRMFPSFDEPLFKSTFSVSVVVPEGMTAIANGRLQSERALGDGRRHMQFATVGRMPSYLLALVVGRFECVGDMAGDTPVRVCAAPEQIDQAPFALRLAKEALLWQEQYFGIPYPYGKLDHVAIPDFAIGAMENVGAILYRSRLLLLDEARSSSSEQRRIAGIIAHETAHQWFGNLVSLKWWDDTWLKEGFASWLENGSLLEHHPGWRIENEYAGSRRTALAADARPSTPSIRRDVKSSSDIRSAFDALSYQKAAAVIRMLEVHAGEDVFREAVRSYFTANSWGNASMADFLAALDQAGPVYPRALQAFTSRPGAPQLEVTARCSDGSREISVRQQRLGSSGASAPWPIPLCLDNGGTRHCLEFAEAGRTFSLPGCAGALFANAGGAGYYVSEHGDELLQQLRDVLYTQLDSVERQTLFHDEWLLVQQGRRDADKLLDLYAQVQPAQDDELVAVIAGPLNQVARTVIGAGEQAAFADYVRGIFAPAAHALGWSAGADDDDQRRDARRRAWGMLGTLGDDAEALRHARAATATWLDGEAVEPSMLPVALAIAGRHGDAQLHRRALAALRDEEDPQRMNRLLDLLGAFAEPALLQATLDAALTDAVRPNEALRLLEVARYTGAQGARRAWAFVQENARPLLDRLPAGHRPYLVLIAAGVCDAAAIGEAEAFAARYPAASDATKLDIVRDEVGRCVAFRERHAASIRRYLER